MSKRRRERTIEVCEGTTEVRELAVMAAAHIEVCWEMLNGARPPDGEALYWAIWGAREAGRRVRDVARKVDEARRGGRGRVGS